jgi:hypothetical protein
MLFICLGLLVSFGLWLLMALCAFWRFSRSHFGVRVCDNLVGGVPACVVAHFYPDSATMDYGGVVVCRHFVRSDVYIPVVKYACYFGGVKCVHSDVLGFGACTGCSRFVC